MVRLVIAVVFFLVLLRIGLFFIRSLAQPMPEPPPPGEMRRVNLRYRCTLCGVELRLTKATEQEPVAPRHCMEEMDLIPSDD